MVFVIMKPWVVPTHLMGSKEVGFKVPVDSLTEYWIRSRPRPFPPSPVDACEQGTTVAHLESSANWPNAMRSMICSIDNGFPPNQFGYFYKLDVWTLDPNNTEGMWTVQRPIKGTYRTTLFGNDGDCTSVIECVYAEEGLCDCGGNFSIPLRPFFDWR